MTLKEHYRIKSRKGIKIYIKFIILIILIISIFPTFSKYANMVGINSILPIAKWSIKINNIPITSGTNEFTGSIELLNVEDNSTSIDSGDTCYFEIIIDPSTTEVAVSYSISVDLVALSNLPEGTKIEKYEKYIYENNDYVLSEVINEDKTSVSINENIMLLNEQTALSSSSIVKYKFYCNIPFPTDITKDTAFTVTPNISVEQYISE